MKASESIARRIYPQYTVDNESLRAVALWDTAFATKPQGGEALFQRSWDRIATASKLDLLLQREGISDFDKACLRASCAPGSGLWLNALPLQQIGLKMSDNELRIAAGLRLGCSIIQPHVCICGQPADEFGIHGLTCPKVPGRRVRHTMANRLIHRALNSADYMSVLEPPHLSRSDGKRPDGLTMVPWSRGKSLVWDFSCSCTIASSHLSKSARTAGSAAESGSKAKVKKYENLSERYIFVPLVVESHGPFCKEATDFFTSAWWGNWSQNGRAQSY